MTDFQFFKPNAKEAGSDSNEMSKEEMQNVARRFGIPNTDRITKDDKGNYYHDNEPLDDNYLKNHKPGENGDSHQKYY